jgi:hypothetical protein
MARRASVNNAQLNFALSGVSLVFGRVAYWITTALMWSYTDKVKTPTNISLVQSA